jgi:hypothetical protein
MSEITIARMKADLEAVRVAELYADHPLLRHMPVPHFRLPSVELDAPVVIKQIDEPPPGVAPGGAPALPEMREAFDKVLTGALQEEGIRLGTRQRASLSAALDKELASLTQPVEVAVGVIRVADALSSAASRMVGELVSSVDAPRQAKLEKTLKRLARVALLELRKPPARLHVLVTTAEIREAGPSEVITRFHLKISEEAFEWTTIETAGREEDRLVIE